jgi:hypothetical protein
VGSSIIAYTVTTTPIPIDLTAKRVYLVAQGDIVRIGETAVSTNDNGNYFLIPQFSLANHIEVLDPGNRLFVRANTVTCILRVWEVGV